MELVTPDYTLIIWMAVTPVLLIALGVFIGIAISRRNKNNGN